MDAVVRPPVRWIFFFFDPLSFFAFPDYPLDLLAHKWLKHSPLFAGRLVLEYERLCACFTIDNTLVTQP
jgi:hypothetical protein